MKAVLVIRIALVVLFLGICTSESHAAENDSLLAMLDRYFAADVKVDQIEVARMILPKDLGMAKKIILDAVAEAVNNEIDVFALLESEFTDISTMSELRKVDSLTLYAKIGNWAMKSLPELFTDIEKDKFTVLGIIDDSPNSKYVMYRQSGSQGTRVECKIVVRQDGRWYSSLEGDWMKLQAAVFGCFAYLHLRSEG